VLTHRAARPYGLCVEGNQAQFAFEVSPARRVHFYVVHPRNGIRHYEDQKSAVRAAKGFVKRFKNEQRFWEREYANS